MKKYIKGFLMSASMFTVFPMKGKWEDQSMPFILPFFPIVGILIGMFWYVGIVFLREYSTLLSRLFFLFIPSLATGCIHLDGYMDTVDAVYSRRSLEEKIRILKDSHVGAFAVVGVIVLFFLNDASGSALIEKASNAELQLLIVILTLARCISAFTMLHVEAFGSNTYSSMFQENTNRRHKGFVIAIGCVAIGFGLFIHVKIGASIMISMLFIGCVLGRRLVREFKGISGDLCGAILVVCEAIGVLVFALMLGA